MRHRMNVYLPPELLQQIADLATRKKLSQSAIVEAAVTSFLSPDGSDRREAAFARRLDRLSRQVQRLERNVGIAIPAEDFVPSGAVAPEPPRNPRHWRCSSAFG